MRKYLYQASIAWCSLWAMAHGQLLDATADQELAGTASSKPFVGYYNLWNLGLGLDGPLPDAQWASVNTAVEAGADVWLDIEPDVSANSAWQRPVDPSVEVNSLSGLEEIAKTHAIIATQLEPLCRKARASGSRVWTYRLFSHMLQRPEDIVNEPSKWGEDVMTTANLEYAPGKKLSDLIRSTGGGELFQVYIPNAWNVNQPWARAKCLTLLERQYQALEKAGLRGMPAIGFHTIGSSPNIDVLEDTMRMLFFTAKARGRYAIWHGSSPGTTNISSTQKTWIP